MPAQTGQLPGSEEATLRVFHPRMLMTFSKPFSEAGTLSLAFLMMTTISSDDPLECRNKAQRKPAIREAGSALEEACSMTTMIFSGDHSAVGSEDSVEAACSNRCKWEVVEVQVSSSLQVHFQVDRDPSQSAHNHTWRTASGSQKLPKPPLTHREEKQLKSKSKQTMAEGTGPRTNTS